MVDFSKRLGKASVKKPTNPIELYETLDRESDKGPLRPVQSSVLADWFKNRKDEKDNIIKIHTGQGKTLIGLLILQSKLNEGKGPAVYLCPNNFLINQTCIQARQFGFNFSIADPELPDSFLNSTSILITSVQKLFNGLTKFGIGARSLPVESIVLDDAHACIDSIKSSFTVSLKNEDNAYHELRTLFSDGLQSQGAGTYADLLRNEYDALLPVPYWDWAEKQEDVARILSKSSVSSSIKYAWPLIKDNLQHCQCIVSGKSLDIIPYLPPLSMFGSYSRASCRIFMSATVTDDSFLINGLGLSKKTITQPIIYKDEKWSGEKMLLIPSLIDQSLTREEIVSSLYSKLCGANYGSVILSPSFNSCRDWEKYGAHIAKSGDIDTRVANLKAGDFSKPVVFVNRYDGIDLPDNSCRLLILDNKPYPESLYDRHQENCLGNTEAIMMKLARTIEQGLGRSVRGEKDYCAIIIIGAELVKLVKSSQLSKYFSNQTKMQIDIGLEIAEFAKEDIAAETEPMTVLTGLISKCLKRDSGWKDFYTQEMNSLRAEGSSNNRIDIFSAEHKAEILSQDGDVAGAIKLIQNIIDASAFDNNETGWYLQEIARYQYAISKVESNKMQLIAHRKNKLLLKPKTGIQYQKLTITSQKRIENIIDFVKSCGSFDEISLYIEDMFARLEFGVTAEKFENALDQLGKCLGFASERPDKEWKEGPDVLWCIRDNEFILFECKNEVSLTRSEINKYETDQINTSIGWFHKNYKGCTSTNIMVISTNRLSKAASTGNIVRVTNERTLDSLRKNIKKFFNEFMALDLQNISPQNIQEMINTHGLSTNCLKEDYSVRVK